MPEPPPEPGRMFTLPGGTLCVCIDGTGKNLPETIVTAAEIDQRAGLEPGWTLRHTGVAERRFVAGESTAFMGANAVRAALEAGSGQPVDLLISAGATPQQLIPCTAALIARELGWSGTPCLDVNATCLGFLCALDLAACAITAGRYRRIAIVCSEVASKGLNWHEPEAAALMGDGAAAVILRAAATTEPAAFLGYAMQTWPEGAHLTEVRGGGSALPATAHRPGENTAEFQFHMDGPGVFRLAAEHLDAMVARFVGTGPDRWDAVDLIIPHQASSLAMSHVRKKLGVPVEKMMNICADHGNVIAASLPLALHEAIVQGRLQRGQTAFLIGTSAGFSMAGALLVY